MRNNNFLLCGPSILLVLLCVTLRTESASGQSPEERSSSTEELGAITGRTFFSKPVRFAVIDGLAIFEGDIILGTADEVTNALNAEEPDPTQTGPARSVVITGSDHRWPNSAVPFELDPNLTDNQRTQITNAITHWETNTPVRFVQRTEANQAAFPDVVHFRNVDEGCSSSVGRRGDEQHINLELGCGTGSIIHEIGHAVGLWHEQSRADRDDFITINWANIEDGKEHNFNQHITDGDDVGPYDCGSIMHYGPNAFSDDGGPTITPNDPACVIGGRAALSAGDILAVNILYPGTFAGAQLWTAHYGFNQGWRVDRHVRVMADINNDQQADVVGFGNAGTSVSLSTGTGFAAPARWLNHYGYNQGWRNEKHVRVLADVNNDQQADIVAFGNAGTYVSLSTGTGFAAPARWLNHYGYNQGWRNERHERVLGDVNNDQQADIVAFGNGGTHVSLSTGTGFAAPERWLSHFGFNQGWRLDRHIRKLADVNNDQRSDVVGFGNKGVHVSLSTGTGFELPRLWVDNYGYSAGSWRVDEHPRELVDLNNDQRADVVGFGEAGVFISISTGVNFGPPDLRVEGFGSSNWRVSRHLRTIASTRSNALPSIVGFGNAGVYVSLNELRH